MHDKKNEEFILATVAAVEDEGLKLQLDGEEEAGEKVYKCAAHVLFQVGDRVKLTPDSGTYIVDFAMGAPMSRLLIPPGGSAGQVLAKSSDNDYKLIWKDDNIGEPSNYIPSGGSAGQVLAKASAASYDLEWTTPARNYVPSGGSTGQVLMKSSNADYALKWGTPSAESDASKLSYSGYSVSLTASGLVPSSSALALGTSGSPFGDLNATGNIRLGKSYGSTLGFFGSYGATKQTVSSSATVSTLITALKAYGLIG